jgi:DNA-binding LytR/AlgR family response regulator
MRIKLDIDPSVLEPEVIIRAGEETEPIREIVSFIRQRAEADTKQDQSLITVYRDNNTARSIDQSDIVRVYTADRKLAVVTRDRKYQMRCTLRELEEILDERWFVRISRFEIINMNWVSGFDLSVKGTIKVTFEDGSYTWVTRRFVPSIGQRLADLAERGDEQDE